MPDNDDVISLHPDDEELELLLQEDEADDNEDDILVELENEIEDEKKKGPEVNLKLANIVLSRFTTRLTEDAMKTRLEKYRLPQNCEVIAPPMINQEMLG